MKSLLSFFGLSLAVLCGAQSSSELTLEEALSVALENNYSIQLSRNNEVIAGNNNTYGNAGFLPTIGASANFNRSSQDTEQEFVSGDTQTRNGAIRRLYGGNIDLQWTLFDGMVMFVTKERLGNEELRAQYEFKFQVDNVIAGIVSSVNRLAFEMERLDLLQTSIDLSKERLEIVQAKYDLGKESKLSLLQAEVDYNTDQSLFIQQQELILQLKLQLLQQMAAEPYDFELTHEIQLDTTLIMDELTKSIDRNPLLMSQLTTQEILKNQMQEIDRAKWPELNFNMGYGYTNLESEAGFLALNQTYDFRFGFTASVNLFNGFNQRRQYQNARVQLESGQIQTAELEYQVRSNIMQVYTTYQNNLRLSKLEERNYKVAIENSEIALERFRLGASNALELREAQVNSINAQLRYYQALLTAKLAEVELKRLTGTLSSLTE